MVLLGGPDHPCQDHPCQCLRCPNPAACVSPSPSGPATPKHRPPHQASRHGSRHRQARAAFAKAAFGGRARRPDPLGTSGVVGSDSNRMGPTIPRAAGTAPHRKPTVTEQNRHQSGFSHRNAAPRCDGAPAGPPATARSRSSPQQHRDRFASFPSGSPHRRHRP